LILPRTGPALTLSLGFSATSATTTHAFIMEPALGYEGFRATGWLVLVNGLGFSFRFSLFSLFLPFLVLIFYLLTGLARAYTGCLCMRGRERQRETEGERERGR